MTLSGFCQTAALKHRLQVSQFCHSVAFKVFCPLKAGLVILIRSIYCHICLKKKKKKTLNSLIAIKTLNALRKKIKLSAATARL